MNWSMVLAALVAFSSAAHLPESLEHPQDDLLAMPSDSSVAALYRMPGMFGFKVKQIDLSKSLNLVLLIYYFKFFSLLFN